MRKFYFLVLALLIVSFSFGQNAANYTFSTATNGSLALDRNGGATDMSTGTTTLLAGGNDDVASSVVSIGFDYAFMGVVYSQFSASSNGFLRLGATAVATTASNQTGTATGAIITAFGGDQATVSAAGANSKVHYKLFGTAPNRVLVVEWSNMKMNYTSYATATAGDGTYQVLIYETTGIVDLKYGAMSVATTFGIGPVIGFSAGTTAGAIGSITSSTNAVTTTGTAWVNNTYTTGAITNLNSAADGSRRVYSFVPPTTPLAPSSLTFTSVGSTTMTLNWTDNATNEVGYAIYRSTDNTNFTYIGLTAANAITTVQTGLTPSTLYYWRVAAVTEGTLSSFLSGSQSTTACASLATGTYSVGPTGTYLNITAVLSALSNGTSGAVVFELQAAYSSAAETFPLTLTNGACSLVGGVTIRPETGATALSISSASTTATIDINGGSNFIIDGRAGGTGTTKGLTIANTSTSGTAVRFINEGSTNTLKYVTLTGVNSGTSSGVILFSTTTGANGNDNNTIDNCDIRDGATTPTIGVYSLGTNTSVSTRNSGNTISNCNIFNFYNSTSTSSGGFGVNLSTGSTDWTITGNSFYQTASRTTFGSGATVSGINIATLTGNNFTVSNNFLGGTAPSCGGTAYTVSSTGSVIFRGIYISVDLTTASNITGNTVRNISLTPVTTSTSQGAFSILNGWVNVNNNIIGSQSATGSITFSTTSTGAMFSGIFAGSGSANGNMTISGNSIGGITVTGTGTPSFRGITFQSSGITATTQYTITNNTIGSLTTANSIQSSTNAGVFGIVGAAAQTTSLNLISGNTIANLTSTSTGTAAAVTGIASAGSTGGYYTVLNNTIRNLSASSAPTTAGTINVVGISHTAATTAGQNISLNTIYALTAATTSAQSPFVIGILYSGPTSGTNVVERNLVYNLTNSATGASPAVQGIYAAAGLTSYQNNMVRMGTDVTTNTQVLGINDAAGTNSYYFNSVHIGGSVTSTQPSYAFLSSVTVNNRNFSNNIFSNARANAGTGKSYAIQVAGTTSNPAGLTLNYNNYYVSGAGTVLGRFNAADVTSLSNWQLAVGQDLSSISANPLFVDAAGATPNLHVSTGTPIEGIGVDIPSITNDFDGDVRASNTPVDLGADAGNFMSYPAISVTPLANTCATTSRTLIATITDADGMPTSGAELPVLYWRIGTGAYTAVTATSLGSNQYQFDFGAGVVSTNIVSYYIAAQDNLGNVGTSPSLGASGFTASPPAAGTAPTAPYSYTILQTLSGFYTVGAAGTFPTLTAAAAAYNNSCLGGPVTFALLDASYSTSETFPITFNANANASATNTLTIIPSSGVTSTITGSVASGALIRLNGADYITIDGSNNGTTSRDLTITNSSTTAPTAISLVSAGLGAGATYNTIKNVKVNTGVATTTGYGIAIGGAPGAAGADNDNNQLINNKITDATIGIYSGGTTAVSAGANDALTVQGNDISTATTSTILIKGIQLVNTLGATVSSNQVSIETTNSGQPVGIALEGGALNAVVTKNLISKVLTTATGGYGARGIAVATGSASSNVEISNNMIYGVNGSNYTGFSNSSSIGIGLGVSNSTITDATGGVRVYYNTVALSGNYSYTANCITAALYVGSGATALDIRNNIFANTLNNTNASGTASKNYAAYSAAANTAFSNINYNDFSVSGTQGVLSFLGADAATLAALQTAFGGNTNSTAATPSFVSATDLHLTNAVGDNLCLNGAATPIAGITTDIDGNTRNATKPDIGADEFNPTLPTFLTNAQSACFGQTVNLTAAAVTAGSAAGQTFTYFTDAACTTAVADPTAVGAGTYYIKATYTSGGCSIEQISSVVVTINALPTVSLTVAETSGTTNNDGTICAGDAVTLTASGATSYSWAPGGATTAAITVSPATTTTYTVTGTDANGCQNTASTTITVNAVPTADISVAETSGTTYNDGTICAGASVTLTASGGTSYLWSNGATTAAITVSPTSTTNYTVTVTNANGCSATTNTTITVNALPTQYSVTGGGAYCASGVGSAIGLSGSDVGISYELYLGGTGTGNIVSGTGSAISFGTITTAGVYTVVATNPTTTCTNTMSGSATVSVNPLPVINYSLNQPSNCNAIDGGATLTLSGAAGPYTFNWTGLGIVQGQQNQTTLRVGSYTVVVTAANGCQATATFSLIGPGGCDVCPTINAVTTTPTAICQAGTATLSAAGLADLGISYGIDFVVSSTPLANPYTGTVVATVANGSLTGGGTTATTSYTFNTAGNQYVYAI
ncbi:MAG: beta strand repeat-containing protein, partial [Bacteroidota bacterium]